MRIGIVGLGFIGREVLSRIESSDGKLETAFVFNRSADRLSDLPQPLILEDLAGFRSHSPDLVVEASHPCVTVQHGADFLSACDYMPLSTTALVDDVLRDALLETAANHGTKLFLPMGALVGGRALAMLTSGWDEVRITFRKHPANMDFSETGKESADFTEPTVIFEGPVRDVAAKFPRNVNTMVTCALLSNGLDKCQAAMIVDPTLDHGVAEVEARGADGGRIRTEKRQPLVGVSGTEMADSVWHSVLSAAGLSRHPMVAV